MHRAGVRLGPTATGDVGTDTEPAWSEPGQRAPPSSPEESLLGTLRGAEEPPPLKPLLVTWDTAITFPIIS